MGPSTKRAAHTTAKRKLGGLGLDHRVGRYSRYSWHRKPEGRTASRDAAAIILYFVQVDTISRRHYLVTDGL